MPNKLEGLLWQVYSGGDRGRAVDVLWTCAKHLTLSHMISLSLKWRDINLMGRSVSGQRIVCIVSLKELWSMGLMSKWGSVTGGIPWDVGAGTSIV